MSLWRKRKNCDNLAPNVVANVHHNEQKPDHLVNILPNLSIKSEDLSIKREKAMREVQRLGQEIEQSKEIEMRQALEMALEFIERVNKDGWILADFEPQMYEAITAIKEALAQPEQEPVGKFAKFTDGIWREVTDGSAGVPLYTTPPQRTWVGLTDEERKEVWWSCEQQTPTTFAKAIEAKLKEKNT